MGGDDGGYSAWWWRLLVELSLYLFIFFFEIRIVLFLGVQDRSWLREKGGDTQVRWNGVG